MNRQLRCGALVATFGSTLGLATVARAADSAPPTFSKDVSPIFQAKCQSCHEPGSIAPIAWYDNTKNNKNNPDPDQWVGYGDRTVDEMAHAWMNVVYLSDQEYQDWQAKQGKPATE